MWSRFSRKLIETLRRDFVAGLLVFVPVGFTILGIVWIVRQLDNLVLPKIFGALGMGGQQPPFVGAIVTLALVLLSGALARSFVGRWLIGFWERLIDRVPVARSLYAVLKQFMEAVFGMSSGQSNFRRVVLIEYPRRGLWSYAFVTGRSRQRSTGLPEGLIQLFVPSTPNPTTGYFLLVHEDDALDSGLTVEEAFKLIISAGIASREEPRPAPPLETTPRPALEGALEGPRSP